jgi:hypothetical protein
VNARLAMLLAVLVASCGAERAATTTADGPVLPAPASATLSGGPVPAAPACNAGAEATPTAEGKLAPFAPATSAVASRSGGGRVLRMLSVDQFHAALLAATGFTWEGNRRMPAPDAPVGYVDDPRADMIVALAPSLGKPDYAASSNESREPSITFAKLSGDAARSACRASVGWDVGRPREERRILRFVERGDTLAANPRAVRANASYLALRFWSRAIAPNDAELGPILTVFDRASRAGSPEDGWRAVCIALVTDPQFMTY